MVCLCLGRRGQIYWREHSHIFLATLWPKTSILLIILFGKMTSAAITNRKTAPKAIVPRFSWRSFAAGEQDTTSAWHQCDSALSVDSNLHRKACTGLSQWAVFSHQMHPSTYPYCLLLGPLERIKAGGPRCTGKGVVCGFFYPKMSSSQHSSFFSLPLTLHQCSEPKKRYGYMEHSFCIQSSAGGHWAQF